MSFASLITRADVALAIRRQAAAHRGLLRAAAQARSSSAVFADCNSSPCTSARCLHYSAQWKRQETESRNRGGRRSERGWDDGPSAGFRFGGSGSRPYEQRRRGDRDDQRDSGRRERSSRDREGRGGGGGAGGGGGKWQGKGRPGFQDKPSSKPDFNPKLQLPPRTVGIQMLKQLETFHQRVDIADCVRAYGLSEEAAGLLLKGGRSKLADEEGAEANDTAILGLMAQWAAPQEDHLRSLLDQWRSDKQSRDTVGSTGGDWLLEQIEALRSLYQREGDRAVERIVVGKFLDWVQSRLGAVAGLPEATDGSFPGVQSEAAKHSEAAAETANAALLRLQSVRQTLDLRHPAQQYILARSLVREIHLHVGPTNSGKTHGALLALSKARSGVFAGPLRLLAHEVWDRINSGTVSPGVPPRACNLVTGEEVRVVDPLAGLSSCTVEMCSPDTPIDVAVVDEIQMIADSQRGYAWTNAVLGLPARELHLCGEASVVPLIEKLAATCGDRLQVHHYKRLTPLALSEESLEGEWKNIRKGDCVVAFSRNKIFGIKRAIEQVTGMRCAVAYGGLPPETRSEQAKLFNDPDSGFDVMVASDAIGMGLNLKIKRVIFESVSKWNGSEMVYLTASQIKQIAGRAGRFGTSSDEAGGLATTLNEGDLPVLRAALDAPVVPLTRAAVQPSSQNLALLSQLVTDSDPRPAPKAAGKGGGKDATVEAHEAEQDDEEHSAAAKSKVDRAKAREGTPRSLAAIYRDVSLLCSFDSNHYYISDFDQQCALSPIIERAAQIAPQAPAAKRGKRSGRAEEQDDESEEGLIGEEQDVHAGEAQASSNSAAASGGVTTVPALSVVEREVFSNAPAAVRDPRVVQILENFVRMHVLGRLVKFEEADQHLGMLEALRQVREVRSKAKAQRDRQLEAMRAEMARASVRSSSGASDGAEDAPQSGDGEGKGNVTKLSVAHYVEPDNEVMHVDTLMVLESLHRSLSLYLWLSFRFPLAFCYRSGVEGLKLQTEQAIEFVLEAIRVMRAARLAKVHALRQQRALMLRQEEEGGRDDGEAWEAWEEEEEVDEEGEEAEEEVGEEGKDEQALEEEFEQALRSVGKM